MPYEATRSLIRALNADAKKASEDVREHPENVGAWFAVGVLAPILFVPPVAIIDTLTLPYDLWKEKRSS